MGAPKGPRVPPAKHTDEAGEFIVYPGKSCTMCAVALTSRNRYGTSLFCAPHGRENDTASRHAVGCTPAPRKARTTTIPKLGSEPVQIPRSEFQAPEYRRLQSLFSAFLNHPTLDDSSSLLASAMNEYELMARLRQVIPACSAQSICQGGCDGAVQVKSTIQPRRTHHV